MFDANMVETGLVVCFVLLVAWALFELYPSTGGIFAGFAVGFLALVATLILVAMLYFELVAWPAYQHRAGRMPASPTEKETRSS